jgi:hypothetical protein
MSSYSIHSHLSKRRSDYLSLNPIAPFQKHNLPITQRDRILTKPQSAYDSTRSHPSKTQSACYSTRSHPHKTRSHLHQKTIAILLNAIAPAHPPLLELIRCNVSYARSDRTGCLQNERSPFATALTDTFLGVLGLTDDLEKLSQQITFWVLSE